MSWRFLTFQFSTKNINPVNLPDLRKIWDFHGAVYEECRLLGCYAVWLL
jgi:hypothetical protein